MESKAPVPARYHAMKGLGKWVNRPLKDACSWNIITVERMLKNREYCGDDVNFKTFKRPKDKVKKTERITPALPMAANQ